MASKPKLKTLPTPSDSVKDEPVSNGPAAQWLDLLIDELDKLNGSTLPLLNSAFGAVISDGPIQAVPGDDVVLPATESQLTRKLSVLHDRLHTLRYDLEIMARSSTL